MGILNWMPSPDHHTCIFGGRSRWFWRPLVNIQPLITAHHLFIPLTVRSQVLQWGQSFKLPGQFIVQYHPQTGQMEQANQNLEASLRCVAAQLLWHHGPTICCGSNLFTTPWAAPPPGMSLTVSSLHCSRQETDVEVQSVQAYLCRARRVWREAWAALTRMAARNQCLAD